MFRYDNPIMRFMGKAFDVLIVNLLWIICSIPIVTIGAATTAMYYVTLKIVRDEDGATISSFIGAFTKNFRQSTIIWLIMLLIPILVGSYLYFYLYVIEAAEIVRSIITTVGIALLVVWVAMFNYIFPSIARFENPIKQTIYNAFAISIAHLGNTFVMLLADIGLTYLTFKIFPLLGFAGIAWFNSYSLQKIFSKYDDSENISEEGLCEE